MWQMVDAMRICYFRFVMAYEGCSIMFIHIQRRLLQDARSTLKGIPEPQAVG